MSRLRRSDPARPGLRRVGPADAAEGGGYGRAAEEPRYVDAKGAPVADAETLDRIASLVIPPAWTEVWICADPRGHIQAVGSDEAGRRQYLYHEEWRRQRDTVKYDRMLELADALPAARRGVARDLRRPGLDRRRALAAAFRLVDRTALRIGGESYRRLYGSRGLTTLLCRHAEVDGDAIRLSFPGKSGQRWETAFHDRLLARYLGEVLAARGPAGRLLVWRGEGEGRGRRRGRGGQWHGLRPEEVNEEIRERTGVECSAKDFRTLRGTIVAAETLAQLGPARTARERRAAERRAIEAASLALGNTPAVARSSYIDPRVLDRYDAGELIELGRSPEAALGRLLRGTGGRSRVSGARRS